MIKGLKEARQLHKEGKLHKKLIFRLFLLAGIFFSYSIVVLVNVFFRGLDADAVAGLFCGGFLFGLLIYYHMNPVQWDEEKELLTVTRIDSLGFVILVIYIILRLAIRFYLEEFYHGIIILTSLSLAIVAGVALGKLLASLKAIGQAQEEEKK